MLRILPGKPYPQGATWDGAGVNFAIYSADATAVELCLFHDDSSQLYETISLRECTGHVWHDYIAGARLGQLYGYRVYGPYDPERGLRFNPAKLLIDPYAKALSGALNWDAPVFGYHLGAVEQDFARDDRDDAWGVPKSVVTSPLFDWGNDRFPRTSLHDSVIYELHVKGFTATHPNIPQPLRGTYAGLAHPVAVDYLKTLGITAVELMPVHELIDDKHLVDRSLRNYWGYNSINFFSPASRYSSSRERGAQINEFKAMVKTLHSAGIEVILDVVYNHTAEGNHLGPTISFKGIDNSTYYRVIPDNRRYYMDYTGTGNTINVRHPQVLKLMMDSLRYWILEMHVDGFRFDLASALARELHEVDRLSGFFDIINQDPVISQVKLIAEPWDVGDGGYQVGNFPPLWAEWNGRYRDTVRRYWRADDGQLSELRHRLTGSSDLYENDGRHPTASINFITAHDGFTLHDLVSYDHKHNHSNREDNHDGTDANDSWNCGVEGETEDPGILDLRERQKRNFMLTLLCSQGVPMISGGDELGRTQKGNNNPYALDNETTWHNWKVVDCNTLLEFTRKLIELRRRHPNLHRRKFLQHRSINRSINHGTNQAKSDMREIIWLRPDRHEMTEEEWKAGWIRCIGYQLNGCTLSDVDAVGGQIRDDTFMILLNAHYETINFYMPRCDGMGWQVILDSAAPTRKDMVFPGEPYTLIGHSSALLKDASVESSSH